MKKKKMKMMFSIDFRVITKDNFIVFMKLGFSVELLGMKVCIMYGYWEIQVTICAL